MSTRAVVYFHYKEEKENNLNYTMKLYHHRDGYPEYLGEKLKEIFAKFKKEYESNNSGSQRELFKAIGEEGGFEMTCWYHFDTEYIYHVFIEDERGFEQDGKKFNYKICIQTDSDHEGCWNEKMDTYYDSKRSK